MRLEVCGSCRYWQQRAVDTEAGECRRNPPTVHVVMIRTPPSQHRVGLQIVAVPETEAPKPVGLFPPSHATSWCGEWADGVKDGDGE